MLRHGTHVTSRSDVVMDCFFLPFVCRVIVENKQVSTPYLMFIHNV